MTITAYVHKTSVGPFSIELNRSGRWHVMWNVDDLGSYHSPQLALGDLVAGHTRWPSCGDPSLLGLSDTLSQWDPFERPVQVNESNRCVQWPAPKRRWPALEADRGCPPKIAPPL
jgi:hypothetical protein